MRLLRWYNWKFRAWTTLPERIVRIFSTCSHFSRLIWAFTELSRYTRPFRHLRILCWTLRLAYTTSKQNLVSVESTFCKWKSLWDTTYTYKVGNPWIWGPIYWWKYVGKTLLYERSLYWSIASIKCLPKTDPKKYAHNAIFWSWFSRV